MAWVLVAGGLTYVGAAAVTGPDRVTPANFSGYATGTGVHAHLLRMGVVGSGSGSDRSPRCRRGVLGRRR